MSLEIGKMVDSKHKTTHDGDDEMIEYIDKLIMAEKSTEILVNTGDEYELVPFDELDIKSNISTNDTNIKTIKISTKDTKIHVKTDQELKQVKMSTELQDAMKRRRGHLSSSVTKSEVNDSFPANNDKEVLKQENMSTELEALMKRRQSTAESLDKVPVDLCKNSNEQLKQIKTSSELEERMEKKLLGKKPSSRILLDSPKNKDHLKQVKTSSELDKIMQKKRFVKQSSIVIDKYKSMNGLQNQNQTSSELETILKKKRLANEASDKSVQNEGKNKKPELKQFEMSSELDSIMKKKRYGEATELEKRELQATIDIKRRQSSKVLDKNAISASNKSNRELVKQKKMSPELEAVMQRERTQGLRSSGGINSSKELVKNKKLSPELEAIMKRRQSDGKVMNKVIPVDGDGQGSLKRFEMSSELELIMERRKRGEEM